MMNTRQHTKLVQEGMVVAEVDITLVESDTGWSPYLSLDDAYKLDEVREALQRGDLLGASKLGRVYKLTPIAV